MAQDAAMTDAVAQDQLEMERRREFHRQGLAERVQARASGQAATLGGAYGSAGQAAELAKQVKNIKNVITLIGGLFSLTIVGILWTILQWNVQLVYANVFRLPGHQYVSLHWLMVGVTLFLDIVILILLIVAFLIVWAITNPGSAFWEYLKSGFPGLWTLIKAII